MPFKRPELSVVLTKANWDKNKGVLAKMAGPTGVGEALDKLEKAYKAVDWQKFEIAANKLPEKEFTLKKLADMQKAAVAEMTGNAAKLRLAAFAARDVARKAGAELRKNKLVPKSAADLCAQIEKDADMMGVGANANSLGSYIEKDVAESRKAYDFTVGQIKTNIPNKVAALATAIKAMGEPTAKSWTAQKMMTRCRDLNQLIGNIPKLTAMGYDLGMDTGKAKTFFEDMRVFASKETPFPADNPEAAKKARADVIALVKRAAVF
jgi:hypothetical protein